MTFCGRRGDIYWGGEKKRQYDAFLVRFGLFVPFLVGNLVHVWDIPQSRFDTCKAIKLRPNASLKKRVLIADWAAVGGVMSLLLCGKYWDRLSAFGGLLILLPSIAMVVMGIILMREPPRVRRIRLVLGTHAWGSSDPATWGKSIRNDVVDPRIGFGVESYSALAERAIADEDWCKAMWAARLCVAVEDTRTGENLTDAILADQEVQICIRLVRRSPQRHKREFGRAPHLRQWLRCDPSVHVFEVS